MNRNRLSRRTMLRGAGTLMSLPLLDAMHTSVSAATPAAPLTAGTPSAPVRACFVFFPNGAIPSAFFPESGEGSDYTLSPTLQPLEKHKDDIIVFRGLTQHHGRANGDGGGDHARNAGSYLTGAQPRKTSGADIEVGISIDQAIASQVGKATRLPSLELGIARGRNAGSCDSGYSCAYSNNISWKTPNTPSSKEINPRLAFERLFGSGVEDTKAIAARAATRRSILDLVSEDAKTLKEKLGRTDRRKIDEYFSSVRDIEQRLDRADLSRIDAPELELPEGVPENYGVHVGLMFDILTLAFQTDATRISTFMMANAGSNLSYPMVDVNDGHHELSHHRDDTEKIEKIKRIDLYMAGLFAGFLDRLKNVKEGDGTLLDNCMIMYGSAISDGNRHSHHDLPIVLAGSGAGTIKTGRYVRHPDETPLNNLFLSIGDRMGADLVSLGDSKEPLPLS